MLTGDLKSKIDQIWNAFWSGGIANPIEVIEQITCLLFLRRLDDLHTLEEKCDSVGVGRRSLGCRPSSLSAGHSRRH